MNDNYHLIKREESSKNEIGFPAMFFTKSVKNVIQTMTGLEAIEVAHREDEEFHTHVTGIVVLTGEKNIMITLEMPLDIAAAITSHMTRTEMTCLRKEEICDGIAELAHMVAGETKVQLKGKDYHFTTLPPFAISGDRHKLVHRNKVVLTKRYRIAKDDLLLKVYFF